jgi:hypothetical protein
MSRFRRRFPCITRYGSIFVARIRSDHVLKGGYSRLEFRAALQSLVEMFTLIGYLLLKVFDLPSDALLINLLYFSVIYTFPFRI